ncbi:MAG: hypothetical protein GX603_03160 [Chloroflexi bacterium]|nr:hypothetical protein [Chloroflexota bacterium]
MTVSPKQKNLDYWGKLEIVPDDLQHLTNHLFETEEPLPIKQLTRELIVYRMDKLAKAEEARKAEAGLIYIPKKTFQPGDKLTFPELDEATGLVMNIREGDNPGMGSFQVIEIEFEDGTTKEFAAGLESHALNQKNYQTGPGEEIKPEIIWKLFGRQINSRLRTSLENQSDLVRIGNAWFPRSLLIDIGAGHLNIAEAILDSMDGGPIGIDDLIEQLELTDSDENQELLVFSLNYALQEDPRFDEVGTTGQFSWFLRRLEPPEVLETPLYLRAEGLSPISDDLDDSTYELLDNIDDELSFTADDINDAEPADSVELTLTYPHWRAGSLPVTPLTNQVFPSALESHTIKIAFIDEQTQQVIDAWIVRDKNYVIGLRDWYESKSLIPGSIVQITRTENPGIMKIQPERKRSNKEWIKTVLVGADGGLVFALLRQPISAGFDERMAIAIPDVAGLDQVWKNRQSKSSVLKNDVMRMMTELSKLNNQRHVHFVDLYASINVIRRTAPMDLLEVLESSDDFFHVGDHYYHITEKA